MIFNKEFTLVFLIFYIDSYIIRLFFTLFLAKTSKIIKMVLDN